MMRLILYPEKDNWRQLIKRPGQDNSKINDAVKLILAQVKIDGDDILLKYAKEFDKAAITDLLVSEHEIEEAKNLVSPDLKSAIEQAAENIETFHRSQVEKIDVIETKPGVKCWRRSIGIQKVGLYIPGGSAPLFSTLLMLGIPAKIANCKEIVVCSPPGEDGKIHPAILYTAAFLGIKKIYKTGGAQAIGAMAYGTKTIQKVDKIFGPGNNYVTIAKQLVQQDGVCIDMPAGPSEVCVLADETANASFIAADLLSQAEHGPDSQVFFITTSDVLLIKVQTEVSRQLKELPRNEIIARSLCQSKAALVKTMKQAIELVNEYSPEHLIIACRETDQISDRIVNAGSVFLGNYSPESAGDYASGTNHTLPTNGYARSYSGVSVDSFVKKITYQCLSEQGLKNIAATVITMAEAEGLQAHVNAIKIRLNV